MRRGISIVFVLALLGIFMGIPAFALNITIIESQSFDPSHTMDIEWANVATAMGHTPTIVPQSTLDSGAFIPGTDVLIVSSASIPLTPTRIGYVFECLYAGRGVYIQSEANPADPGNNTWQEVVNMFPGSSFTWTGTMGGTMRPTVHNHIGAELNAEPILSQMFDGCFGIWGPGIEGNLRWQNNELGYVFDPLNHPFAGMGMTNSDQDWIITAPDYQLMENYINVLIDQPILEMNIRIFPVGGPITIPAAGGSFDYQVQVNYTGTTPITFQGWIRLILPSGAVYPPPLMGPFPATWTGPTTTPLYTWTQAIPGYAPAGTYYVQGVLADTFPGFFTVFDSDNFGFQKF